MAAPVVGGGGLIPGQAAGQYVFGLQSDVFRLIGRPSLEAGEDIWQVQTATFQQRLGYMSGHLRIVGGLAGVPAAASTHLAAGTRYRKAGEECARRAELEGSTQRIAHSRADDRANGTPHKIHTSRLLSLAAPTV
nr:hypothetical protein [Nonomuraea pusilla]